jgi:hypothetical protein
MEAAHRAIRIIRCSAPAGHADMDVSDEHAPGRDWLAIISRPTLAEFARAFTDAPVLEASVLANPIIGAPGIRSFFEATRAMYGQIAFTAVQRAASRTWLEWRGEYRGLPVSGVTTLIAGPGGAIGGVRIFHMPLDQLIAFAAELQERLAVADQGDIPCR